MAKQIELISTTRIVNTLVTVFFTGDMICYFITLYLSIHFSPEPANSNNLCPRRNGFFAHPDQSVCNVFYNCIEGEAIEVKCTAGLHFDEYSGTCVWPDTAARQGCQAMDSKYNQISTFKQAILVYL